MHICGNCGGRGCQWCNSAGGLSYPQGGQMVNQYGPSPWPQRAIDSATDKILEALKRIEKRLENLEIASHRESEE